MATAMRCPECGALVGEAAEWCTQCYADLRPPVAEPEPAPVRDAPETGEEGSPAEPARHRMADGDAPEPGWPCPRCGTVNDLAADACSSCGAGFLAGLADDRGIPAVPALTTMPRGARIAVALVAVLVILLLLGGALWLVG